MNLIKKLERFFTSWYIRYLLATELYIVETWEKVAVHILFTVLLMAVWYFNYAIVFKGVAQIRGTSNNYAELIS